jgi:hypothetical protein
MINNPTYLIKIKAMAKKKLSSEQHEELLKTLKARFEKNMNRHKGT